MIEILNLTIAIIALLFLFNAYMNKNELAKLVSYIILGAILIQNILSSFAQVALFDSVSNLTNGIGSLIPFIQIGLIIFLTFFFMTSKADKLMKRLVIIFSVLVLLVEFGVFK